MVWNKDIPNAQLLYKINLASSSLSLIASSLMTYHGLKTKNKSITLKLILAIAISDLIYSITNILTAFENEENNEICHLDAFLRQFSVTSSIFWVTCTAIICYKSSKPSLSFNQNRFFTRAIFIGASVSLFPTLL